MSKAQVKLFRVVVKIFKVLIKLISHYRKFKKIHRKSKLSPHKENDLKNQLQKGPQPEKVNRRKKKENESIPQIAQLKL